MSQENFDEQIEAMIKADTIRINLVPDSRRAFYMIKTEWRMDLDPYRIQWIDPLTEKVCLIHVLDLTGEGDKYVMFTTYHPEQERVTNYVFEKDKYVTEEE